MNSCRFAGLISFILFSSFSYAQIRKTASEITASYQTAGRFYHSPNANDHSDSLALAAYARVIRLLSASGEFGVMLSDSYLKSGIIHMGANKQTAALNDFRNGISVIQQNKIPDSLLFQPYLYTGSIHYTMNDLDSGIYYFKKAEALNNKYGALGGSERLFNKFGALYYETGDYNKSISYFEKALSLTQEKTPVNIFFVINYKNNIATALMKLGRYDEALKIFEALLKYGNPEDELYYNISSVYFESGNYSSALLYLRRVKAMYFEKNTGFAKIYIALHMVAARSAATGGPVHALQLVAGLRHPDRTQRRAQWLLCGAYALGSMAVIGLSDWVDGGLFEDLQRLIAQTGADGKPSPEVDAILADPRLAQGMLVRVGLAGLLSVPFWYAPALVHWGGQGAGQAMFTSTLALWRTRGALSVYMLGWLGAMLAAAGLVMTLGLLTGARSALGWLTMPVGLILSAVFYISLWFSFTDTFGQPDTKITP